MLCLAFSSGCANLGHGDNEVMSGDPTALVAAIDAKRKAIEAKAEKLTHKTLSTTDLRPQVKQKWSKIEYYVDGSQVARIKTYPHAQVSERTEEFYFDRGELMYAYIQDRGAQDHERGGPRAGKEYYYAGGKFVTEKNSSSEPEHTIRHSDEERLEQEALEYLALYAAKVKG